MIIDIHEDVLFVIEQIAEFVESKNTIGSGNRYAVKFLRHINETLSIFSHHSICISAALAKRNLRCFHYNDWIIAYYKYETKIEVRIIIHGSLINN